MSIMQSALEMADAAAAGRRIARLRLRVGAASGVVPDALVFAFEALTPGTPAEGAQLELELVEVACRCPECGREFAPEGFLYACPACGAFCQGSDAGRELVLASLEVHDD